MKVSLRTLLTAMCALCVVISVATLWPASAIMAIESLTTAREDQLLTSSYQTGQQVLTYFETASKAAKLMASMYNSSTLKNPEEPEVQFMQDYFNTLYFTFRDAPVLEFVIIVTLKDPAVVASMPQADQACDTDGIMMLPSFAAVFNNNTSGSMGCTDSLLSSCAPGAFQFLMTGGETVPSDPGQLFMKMFQADCSNVVGAGALWAEGLPGDLGQLDSGIRAPSWSDGVFAAGSGDSQFLLRKVFFNLIGPAWAPFGAVGGLSQRMSQATAVEGQVTVSLVDLLEEAASISTSKDKLMVISAHRKIVAVSDRSINVETFDEQGMLTLHYADNATAIGDYLADIATRILETYCDQSRCDWSNAKGLIRVAGSVVALEPLNDAFAEDLNLLLVSAVKESDILEPAHELNLNIAICACAVLVVLSGASFVMANYLSTPITNFSERLVAASLMQDLDTTGRPFVSEIDSMENALSALVAQLLEYKSFLPSSMFEADDDDTDGTEELQPSTEKSVTGSVAKKSAAFAPSMRSLASSRSRGKPAAVSTKCALKSKNIIILCTNLRRWSEFVYGEGLDETKVVTEQSTYITLITSTLCGKGTIDRFNGDRVVISFGSVNACASSTACKLAHKALQVLAGASAGSLKKGIGAGMSKGKMLVGNSGDKTVRAFNFMGPAVNIAWKLSDIATSFCQPADFELLLDGPFHKDVEIEVESFSVGSLKMDEKFPWLATSHRLRMLYLVMQMKEADAEAEWMYQVEQLQGEEGVSLQSVMDLIFHADLDLKVYEVNCPLLVDLLTAAKKPVLIEKLTKSYVDFCVNVRNKL